MAKVYKIHPSVGIARVGQSQEGFFLAPESSGGARLEITQNGDVAFTGFKDSKYLIKRQAARFRVYEYDDDGAGNQTLIGEVKPHQATIRWTVKLVNSKAAGPTMTSRVSDLQGERVIVADYTKPPRNNPPPGFTRADLAANVALTVTGINQTPQRQFGKIVGRDVFIGEAVTDHSGRLVVLGGHGEAHSWQDPPAELGSYLNNPTWYDDVADGSVDAVLLSSDGQELPDKVIGAWVIIGPPDFAPDIAPIVSLYDVMVDAMVRANRLERPRTSYLDDVLPLLQRVAAYKWTNSETDIWVDIDAFLNDPNINLSDGSNTNKSIRQKVFDRLMDIMKPPEALTDFRFTKEVQLRALKDWVDGEHNFIPGHDPDRTQLNEAQEIDRAVLSATIGSGFFPGIEAGFTTTRASLYSEPLRFTRTQFEDVDNTVRTLESGFLTQRMACPWQADFTECLRNWWPAQRPDAAHYDKDLSEVEALFWDRGILLDNDADNADQAESKKNMVERVHRLGVIERAQLNGQDIYAEIGRDPTLPETA